MRAPTLFACVLLLWLTQSNVAHANLGIARDPAQWSGPHALVPANLTVENEQLRIVCVATASGQARCQLAADTNFSGLWVVAPTIEAASDFVLILPSCGLGLGLPVRIAPHTAVGMRGQLSMMFASVGLSFGMDVFPRDSSPLQLTLLGQISL